MQTWQGAPLIGGRPQDIVFLRENVVSQKARNIVWSLVQCRDGVQGDDIGANMDQRFIDKISPPQSVHETIW